MLFQPGDTESLSWAGWSTSKFILILIESYSFFSVSFGTWGCDHVQLTHRTPITRRKTPVKKPSLSLPRVWLLERPSLPRTVCQTGSALPCCNEVSTSRCSFLFLKPNDFWAFVRIPVVLPAIKRGSQPWRWQSQSSPAANQRASGRNSATTNTSIL